MDGQWWKVLFGQSCNFGCLGDFIATPVPWLLCYTNFQIMMTIKVAYSRKSLWWKFYSSASYLEVTALCWPRHFRVACSLLVFGPLQISLFNPILAPCFPPHLIFIKWHQPLWTMKSCQCLMSIWQSSEAGSRNQGGLTSFIQVPVCAKHCAKHGGTKTSSTGPCPPSSRALPGSRVPDLTNRKYKTPSLILKNKQFLV